MKFESCYLNWLEEKSCNQTSISEYRFCTLVFDTEGNMVEFHFNKWSLFRVGVVIRNKNNKIVLVPNVINCLVSIGRYFVGNYLCDTKRETEFQSKLGF